MVSEVRTPRLTLAEEFSVELHRDPAGERRTGEPPLHRESIQGDLADLIDETLVRGVLAERLPSTVEPGACSIAVESRRHGAATDDAIDAIAVRIDADAGAAFELAFRSGRWMRRCQEIATRLQREGALGEGRTAYAEIVAERADERAPAPRLSPLQPPEIADAALAELGIRALDPGELDPERPVLVNARMVEEIQRWTEQAGANETGGGTLGRIVRLRAPLPGTTTRIVTVLTASFIDPRRHVGLPGKFTFDPQALVDTALLAEQRELGESVLTVFHSHGWGTGCNRCNQSATCVLPEIDVSHEDHALLECLFPGKATLLPIAGRRFGAPGARPVLEIHAWRGGRMAPLSWRTYQD